MDYWPVWTLLTVLLIYVYVSGGVELTFELPDNAKECFYQEIQENVSSTLEFQVKVKHNISNVIENTWT
jgi:protein ERP2